MSCNTYFTKNFLNFYKHQKSLSQCNIAKSVKLWKSILAFLWIVYWSEIFQSQPLSYKISLATLAQTWKLEKSEAYIGLKPTTCTWHVWDLITGIFKGARSIPIETMVILATSTSINFFVCEPNYLNFFSFER